MNWTDFLWYGSMGASGAVALPHILVWARRRAQWSHLAFALLCLSYIGMAGFELAMMQSTTPSQFGSLQRWSQVPITLIVVLMVVFVRTYFGPAGRWLGHAAWLTRVVALGANFVLHPNLNFTSITGLEQVDFLGQTVVVAIGQFSPWTWVGRASSLLLLAYIAWAAIAFGRGGGRDHRRRAVTVGGGLFIAILVAAVHTALVQAHVVHSPYLVSIPFLVALIAMGSELSFGVIAAAEEDARLRSVIDSAMDGIVILDDERRIVAFNPAAERMFDRRSADVLGFPLTVLEPDRARHDGPTSLAAFVSEAADGCRTAPGQVLAGLGANNEMFPLAASVSRVTVGSRALTTLILRDVSEEMRVKEEAARNRDEVAHLSRVALMNELAGTLAHELNQPLGAILSNAQAIRRLLDAETPDWAEVRETIEDVITDDRRASDLVHNIRAFMRRADDSTEGGNSDLCEVFRQVLRLARGAVEACGATARIECQAGALPVRAGEIQLQQVALNLVMNALDSMADTPPGDRVLTIRIEPDGSDVRASVSDRGHGIPPEIEDRLFEPFVTTRPAGMGMGLSVCRTIVTAHGGRIEAWNDETGGATFSFTVPEAPRQP